MRNKLQRWVPGLLGTGLLSSLVITAYAAHRADDFVEVTSLNPNIVISLPYATEDNFCDQVLYPVERCFLRRSVAERLDKVQKDLEKEGYGLKIWDGYRPRSVQYKMWAIKPNSNYVANPRRGSRHNRGAAVDLTLIDFETKQEVKMPTDYDVFSLRAHAYYSNLPKEVLANKRRLQTAMTKHGFQIMKTEWWHFDASGWTRFPLMNRRLGELAKEADALKEPAETDER
ncbi:MAG: M15 family metallopeptidase [Verrucomicrobiales bacterium]|nr:M15 family metallopeptidase [Verrucomicrobiales bacterium]